ncbi:uncharacterized protein LOC114519877 [Dendronephthya gigantea]|uniref:uncharacterized protein LOC114519877 n=1 Tax=Dendronephthya gigantea TaxID=151771 RepID=UPI00106B41F9|nr:uncharacterized protein LOC114519877 [Dendronephthya gigantea]XP_028395859.1 uncharacterized protein LOC114519877 [Dendronephthya gigantea]
MSVSKSSFKMKILSILLLFFAISSIDGATWSVVPGRLMQVDVSPVDDEVWGVSSGHQIWHYRHSQENWQRIPGLLNHVSVGEAGVWGVNKDNHIFYRKDYESVENSAGVGWVRASGLLKQIDSGPRGIVYGVNSNNDIFCRTGISHALPFGNSWRHVVGKLKYISCGNLGCWGVNSNDDIFIRHGVTAANCAGSSWQHIPGKLKQIEVGANGVVLGVNSGNNLYRRLGITAADPDGTGWQLIGSAYKHVSPGKNTAWGITHGDYILYTNVVAPRWTLIPNRNLDQLDVNHFGVVWGVNSAHLIFNGPDTWRSIPGLLKHVSVGNAGVWGVNSNNHIFYREGVTSSNLAGTSWSHVPGGLKQIDSGPTGIVYGVNNGGHIYCRVGITSDNLKGSSWVEVGGRLEYVACGPYGCWGVNSNYHIWVRTGMTADRCQGFKWTRIPGLLSQVEVSSEGHVYGVNSAKIMYVRLGITPSRPLGTHWKQFIAPPSINHVASGPLDIYSIDQNDKIYHFTGLRFPEERYAILLTDKFPKGGIGKITVTLDHPDVRYSLTDCSSPVWIHPSTGELSTSVDVDETNVHLVNNSRFSVKATIASEEVVVAVVIYVLPLYHGDALLLPALQAVRTGQTTAQSITLNYGPTAEITPQLLDRSLKQIPADDPIAGNAVEATTQERTVQLVEVIIIGSFENEYGRGAVQAFFHLQDLFSPTYLQHLIAQSGCHATNEVIDCPADAKYRRSDGRCSNLRFPQAGGADTPYVRLLEAIYYDPDGLNDPIGFPGQINAPNIPSPYAVSRDFIRDEVASSADPSLTQAVMQMGQFLDHDLDLSAGGEGSTACNAIPCDGSAADFASPCYPILPLAHGQPPCTRFVRSSAMCHNYSVDTKREQVNIITAVIDGNNVYGSSENTTLRLRDLENDVGLMRVSLRDGQEYLPDNPNDPICIEGCFEAGDLRANEQQGLTSFHTLFLREHNRIARKLKQLNNHWSGEIIFQEARKIVGAIIQKIVYQDYLPIILGPDALPAYTGHDDSVKPDISNAFASAAYRFGHSTIRSRFELLDKYFEPILPAVKLRFLFFNNTITRTLGIEPILLGLVGNGSEKVDVHLTPEITEHLFERGNEHGENLAALNLQRSRDHGLPGYNAFRKYCGLPSASNFDETSNEITDKNNRDILKRLYGDPNLVDLWLAGIAEAPVPGATVGPTLRCIIREQFLRSRDGDRFYYANDGVFTAEQLVQIRRASLSRLYCDNVAGIVSIQKDAFRSPQDETPRVECGSIKRISLCKWKECDNGASPTRQNGECVCI